MMYRCAVLAALAEVGLAFSAGKRKTRSEQNSLKFIFSFVLQIVRRNVKCYRITDTCYRKLAKHLLHSQTRLVMH